MRDGLRSCGSRGRDIVDEDDHKVIDLNDSVTDFADDEENGDGDMVTPKEECDEVVEGLNDDVRKRGSVGVEIRKKARKRGFDDGVPVRVLRSRVVMGGGVKNVGVIASDGTEQDARRISDNDENQKVEEFLNASGDKPALNTKRGRPPKSPVCNGDVMRVEDGGNVVEVKSVQVEKGDEGASVKKRRGRPPRQQGADGDTLAGEQMRNKGKGEIRFVRSGSCDKKSNKKRKPGRPPKSKISDGVTEEDDDYCEGRMDVDGDNMDELKSAEVEKTHEKVNTNRKRGRRPKSQISDGVAKIDDEGVNEGIFACEEGKDLSKVNLSKVGTVPFEVEKRIRGSNESGKDTLENGLDENDELVSPLKRKAGKRPKLQDSVSDKEENTARSGRNQRGSTMRPVANKASDKTPIAATGSGNKKKKKVAANTEGDEEVPRSTAKQMVRDKIVDMLMKAGWTVEYRPRNNKVYNDAVYVNPGGRTHWSVTLAYKVLKQEYESGKGNVEAAQKGFVFTPLPEEELGMLARITSKERDDKGKKKGSAGKSKTDEVTKKKKLKDKSSIRKQDNGADRRKRCPLLVRRSNNEVKSGDDGYIPYWGKRTMLAWLIDSGTMPENSKVRYMNQKEQKVLREGIITRDGINCDCCNEVFTLSDFEKHAGSQLCQPYQNIYLESGTSVLECQLDSWRKEEEFKSKWFHLVDVNCEDPNDDTCNLCGDGGNLVCCDGCPSTFHQSCLAIENFPSGDWQCFRCTCKFCKEFGGNADQQDSSVNTTTSALNICRLCEEKYHEECLEETSVSKDDTTLSTFCGKKCEEIFERLQPLLGVEQELEEGFSWRLIQRTDVNSDISLHETQKNLEGNLKLAIALSVMNECFLPLADHKSGVNLMRNILYSCGSNFSRLNYTGFYTAILERDDEVIAAASIRIHGCHLAEMPFIGVRDLYRRQGMCRRLLSAIEIGLGSLNVEKLVIPAITELIETWTSIFGFKPVEPSSRLNMRHMNIIVFPGTDMLQKPLLDNQPNIVEGLGSIELVDQITHERGDPSDMGHLDRSGHDIFHVTKNELTAVESSLHLLNESSCQSSCAQESVDLPESFTGKDHPVGVNSAVDDNNGCSESNAALEEQGGTDDNILNNLDLPESFTGKDHPVGVNWAVDDNNGCSGSNAALEEQGGTDDNILNNLDLPESFTRKDHLVGATSAVEDNNGCSESNAALEEQGGTDDNNLNSLDLPVGVNSAVDDSNGCSGSNAALEEQGGADDNILNNLDLPESFTGKDHLVGATSAVEDNNGCSESNAALEEQGGTDDNNFNSLDLPESFTGKDHPVGVNSAVDDSNGCSGSNAALEEQGGTDDNILNNLDLPESFTGKDHLVGGTSAVEDNNGCSESNAALEEQGGTDDNNLNSLDLPESFTGKDHPVGVNSAVDDSNGCSGANAALEEQGGTDDNILNNLDLPESFTGKDHLVGATSAVEDNNGCSESNAALEEQGGTDDNNLNSLDLPESFNGKDHPVGVNSAVDDSNGCSGSNAALEEQGGADDNILNNLDLPESFTGKDHLVGATSAVEDNNGCSESNAALEEQGGTDDNNFNSLDLPESFTGKDHPVGVNSAVDDSNGCSGSNAALEEQGGADDNILNNLDLPESFTGKDHLVGATSAVEDNNGCSESNAALEEQGGTDDNNLNSLDLPESFTGKDHLVGVNSAVDDNNGCSESNAALEEQGGTDDNILNNLDLPESFTGKDHLVGATSAVEDNNGCSESNAALEEQGGTDENNLNSLDLPESFTGKDHLVGVNSAVDDNNGCSESNAALEEQGGTDDNILNNLDLPESFTGKDHLVGATSAVEDNNGCSESNAALEEQGGTDDNNLNSLDLPESFTGKDHLVGVNSAVDDNNGCSESNAALEEQGGTDDNILNNLDLPESFTGKDHLVGATSAVEDNNGCSESNAALEEQGGTDDNNLNSLDLPESFNGKDHPVGVNSAVDDNNGCSESNAALEEQGATDDNILNNLDLPESFTGKDHPVGVTSAVNDNNGCSESNVVLERQGGTDDNNFNSLDLPESFTGKDPLVGMTLAVDDNNGCSQSNAALEEQGGNDDNNLYSLDRGFLESKSQIVNNVPVSKPSAEDITGALHNSFTDCSSQFLLVEGHQTGQSCRNKGECASKAVVSDLCTSTIGVANDLEVFNVTQIDSCPHDPDLVVDECQISTGSLRCLESNSQAEQSALQCTSESMSDTKSVPSIAGLCASGGGNACGSEVMILSNQAS